MSNLKATKWPSYGKHLRCRNAIASLHQGSATNVAKWWPNRKSAERRHNPVQIIDAWRCQPTLLMIFPPLRTTCQLDTTRTRLYETTKRHCIRLRGLDTYEKQSEWLQRLYELHPEDYVGTRKTVLYDQHLNLRTFEHRTCLVQDNSSLRH
jgi:hypothetical protein